MSLVIDGTVGSLLCALVVYLWSQANVSVATESTTLPEHWILIPGALATMVMMVVCFVLCYYLLEKVMSACCTINLLWRKLVSFMRRF